MARFLRKVQTSSALSIALIWLALRLPMLLMGFFLILGAALCLFGYLKLGVTGIAASVIGFFLPFACLTVYGWISHLARRFRS